MGKTWDGGGVAFEAGVWKEVLRAMKPGAHLLAFGGTRTYHRLVVAIEDAGFEIRDSLHWIYGVGFPKGSAIDKSLWAGVLRCQSKESALLVEQSSSPVRLMSSAGGESIVVAPALIHPEGAKVLLIQIGEVEDSSVSMGLFEQIAANTSLNIGSLWKNISDGNSDPRNMYTTRTETSQTIDSKTWNYLISACTPVNTTPAATLANGSSWFALSAAVGLSGGSLNTGAIPVLTVLGPATSNLIVKNRGRNLALKPSHEPIVLARKPFRGTVAECVQTHGTGGLCIDGCRVGDCPSGWGGKFAGGNTWNESNCGLTKNGTPTGIIGRWPPNVILSHTPDCGSICSEDCPVREIDRQGPQTKAGGVSRFFPIFRYNSKASKKDRNMGLPDGVQNKHPTVKPIDLMRWLIRLITPPGGVVLDPFQGSGRTGVAAVLEGFRYIGIELEEESHTIAKASIEGVLNDR